MKKNFGKEKIINEPRLVIGESDMLKTITDEMPGIGDSFMTHL